MTYSIPAMMTVYFPSKYLSTVSQIISICFAYVHTVLHAACGVIYSIAGRGKDG